MRDKPEAAVGRAVDGGELLESLRPPKRLPGPLSLLGRPARADVAERIGGLVMGKRTEGPR